MIANPDILEQVKAEALRSAAGDLRWTNAIQRGAELITENRCAVEDDETLLILSPSGHDYRTTVEECRDVAGQLCPAFSRNRPCKHRAAFRLLVRCNERAWTATEGAQSHA